MTEEELLDLLQARFCDRFADAVAEKVVAADAVGVLYRVATAPHVTLPAAVRVWAVEVLKQCRERVEWVAGAWDDLVEAQARGATPGIVSRMRRSWLA